jgi:bifunctional DNA-binding transcriptional regulator/antitoxin component of YhaV-PrlF toxin-antitoxin module
MRKRVTVKTKFISDGRTNGGASRARVPAEVRDSLGAKLGDTLLFEEGCEETHARAALRGKYFIVRVAKVEAIKAEEAVPDAQLEPLSEAVRKKVGRPA